jgi:quercetin dioxygenase-like cupin family protein
VVAAWRAPETPEEPRFLEQQIFTTGRLIAVRCEYRPGSEFEAHQHPQEQVTIVEAGVLTFQVGGREIPVRDGEMITIPGGVRHCTIVGSQAPVRALNLFVNDRVPASRSLDGCAAIGSPLN